MQRGCDKDARRNANKTRDTSRVTKSEFSIGFEDRGTMIIGYRSSPRGGFSSAVRADYLGQEKFGMLPIYRTSDANINRYAKAKQCKYIQF